ncbi:MAG TPA: N-acetylmuramoyl-L-alanine amidase [Puia sp.]|nr:N-acetylmuramoyl-L-alanine amidase [Puia sp.]
MKRSKHLLTLLAGGTFFALTSFHPGDRYPAGDRNTATPRPTQKQAIRTIIIDPGHGGFDHGTAGLFSLEKNVALAISVKLGAAINEAFPDIKVVYTRTTDVMPGVGVDLPPGYTYHSGIAAGLNYRADLANRSKGDLFICIHCDNDGHPAGPFTVHRIVGHKYVGKGKRRHRVPIYESYTGHHTRKGTEAFIWKADRSGFKGEAINERSEFDDPTDSSGEKISDSAAFEMNSPAARMRTQLYEQKFFANTALFATLVEDEFTRAGRESEGVIQRDEGLRVLQATGMPSVLIETGFLSNEDEEKYLNSEDGQNEIARNILDALKRYKATLEGHPISNADSSGGHSNR